MKLIFEIILGTFSNRTGLSSQTQCADCTPGFYCSGNNLTSPSGPCAPGYYCTSGNNLSFTLLKFYSVFPFTGFFILINVTFHFLNIVKTCNLPIDVKSETSISKLKNTLTCQSRKFRKRGQSVASLLDTASLIASMPASGNIELDSTTNWTSITLGFKLILLLVY